MNQRHQSLDTKIQELRRRFHVIGTVDLVGVTEPQWPKLEQTIGALYKQEFDDLDRIIVITDRDWYRENKNCGVLLESLQRIINHIDISNFFVVILTSNHDIQQEINWIQHNVSLDPIPMCFEIFSAPFHRLSDFPGKIYDISQRMIDASDSLHDISTNDLDLLENDAFCLAPWTHLSTLPSKVVVPCCVSDYELGNLSRNALSEIWNNDKIKDLRRAMLAGDKHPACKICHQTENFGKPSYRTYINRKMTRYLPRVSLTEADGHLDQFELNYLHFKFNNLCNLTCRMCGPELSTAWHAVASDLGKIQKKSPILITANDDGKLFCEVIKHLPHVDLIKFTGGEPLMMKEFYDILDLLLEQNRSDVELFYNTNLTHIRYRDRSIFDLWQNFGKVVVGASLDAEGARGEYLRSGSKWHEIVQNRKHMIEQCSRVEFFISATVTILNAWHLPDFHRSWVEKGLIRPCDFDINLLHSPSYLRLDSAPFELKIKIRRRYLDHLNWLRPLDKTGRSVGAFESILDLLNYDQPFDKTDFWTNVSALDRYYNTDLLTVFPELDCLR